ncbi:glycosyl transferase family protein [Sphingopyxis yananensis]|uniref:glycosyl transferase family protein n=1 Tax=Sphingopyxis yananensis TaxID=2886687 RepID=UPI001D10A9A8|nr:glycosyl transferase family protein [Sphingopyxis yananensis]MCC2602831.1 glycosyl transferase family protein [Sphingopyxis yananensis]
MEYISTAMDSLVWMTARELLLFAAIGILLIGLDDLLFDLMWLGTRRKRRAMAVHVGTDDLPGGLLSGRGVPDGALAIFLPAWDEHEILADTLARMLAAWDGEDFCIYLGCYPNDERTILSVSHLVSADSRLRLVVADRDGPTTKGHNLNQMWTALGVDERTTGQRYAGVILHDAEDIVHPLELAVYRRMLAAHSMVQIPVQAIIPDGGLWVSGHYADEFAEAHRKELPLRSALGLPIPSAGVGCALSRDAVTLLAMERDGLPFRPDSLTEDYEIGILIGTYGLSAAFVDARGPDGSPIVSRGEFPNQLKASVRQKARWVTGIALAGWGHLGWPPLPAVTARSGKLATLLGHWMLWRDRRGPLAAVVILAGYVALALLLLHLAGREFLAWNDAGWGSAMTALLTVNAVLLVWRLAWRMIFTAQVHGWRQGLCALPRALVANMVAISASWQAVRNYIRMIRSGQVVWAKTHHGKKSGLAPMGEHI